MLLPKLKTPKFSKFKAETINQRISRAFWKYSIPQKATTAIVPVVSPQRLVPDAFIVEAQGWSTVGTSPWIDTDDGDTSYIQPTDTWMSYFTFKDLVGMTSITGVYYNLKCRRVVGIGSGNVRTHLWDGSAWNVVGDAGIASDSYILFDADVTSILNTVAKVNAARLKYELLPSTDTLRITYAYLSVSGT